MDKTILFICAGYGGGIGKMLRFVMKICVGKFRKVYLVHRGRESENDMVPFGVEELMIPLRGNNILSRRLNEIKNIRNVLKIIKPTIVCCFGSEMGVMLAFAMVGMKNIKLIQAQRGDPYTLPKLWAILSKWSYIVADYCVFQLEKQGYWYGKKIMLKSKVIPNAFVSTGNIDCSENKKEKSIVSVGRFVYEKGYESLIKAFKIVHSKFPDYVLIIYGEGPYRKKYEELIESLELSDCVKLPGYVSNSMDVIKNASVFVLSSLYEGIPNVLIEAMAVGVPTVSTDCTPGGPDFLTDHGRRGLLVPINNERNMADSIIRIIESPELAMQLSKLGKEIVDELAHERIERKWHDFFDSFIKD